jgi:7-keto-8-aminopelargonate synthetase-like enzyme
VIQVHDTHEQARLTWRARLVINEAHSTGLYESDGRRMVALLELEDRVIAQLYMFYKAFGASGCGCLSTCQYELLDELIHSRAVDEHIQLRAI